MESKDLTLENTKQILNNIIGTYNRNIEGMVPSSYIQVIDLAGRTIRNVLRKELLLELKLYAEENSTILKFSTMHLLFGYLYTQAVNESDEFRKIFISSNRGGGLEDILKRGNLNLTYTAVEFLNYITEYIIDPECKWSYDSLELLLEEDFEYQVETYFQYFRSEDYTNIRSRVPLDTLLFDKLDIFRILEYSPFKPRSMSYIDMQSRDEIKSMLRFFGIRGTAITLYCIIMVIQMIRSKTQV